MSDTRESGVGWGKRSASAAGEPMVDPQHALRSIPGSSYDAVHWSAVEAVRVLLAHVGEDVERAGLLDTPDRVARALREMTSGYRDDPAAILARTFDDRCDEMVVVSGVDFTSLCEHHLLPFVGVAHVAYLPGERVVGLSKLARLVDCYARRLQVQERMTVQIAEAIAEHLSPRGVGVVVEAHHSCMGCRGVRKPNARMVTSAMHGVFRDEPEARAEFLALIGKVGV